jgi:hypothetical protein
MSKSVNARNGLNGTAAQGQCTASCELKVPVSALTLLRLVETIPFSAFTPTIAPLLIVIAD